jgi:hypothetical protein
VTIQDLGSLGELIAALATLVTLVYLATQVRQAKRDFYETSQRARSEFTTALSERSAALQLAWFSPEGRNETMMKALLTDERLTREEAFEFAVQMAIFIGHLVQSEQLFRRGLLEPEFVHTRRSIFQPYLELPRVQRWWQREGRDFYAYDEVIGMIDRMIGDSRGSDGPERSTAGSESADPAGPGSRRRV